MKEGWCQKGNGSHWVTKPFLGACECTWHWTWPWLSLARPTMWCTCSPLLRISLYFGLKKFARKQTAYLPEVASSSHCSQINWTAGQTPCPCWGNHIHSRLPRALWDGNKMQERGVIVWLLMVPRPGCLTKGTFLLPTWLVTWESQVWSLPIIGQCICIYVHYDVN